MKQSGKQFTDGTAALYCRLSRDKVNCPEGAREGPLGGDNMDSESNSISNHDVMYRGWITPKNITS